MLNTYKHVGNLLICSISHLLSHTLSVVHFLAIQSGLPGQFIHKFQPLHNYNIELLRSCSLITQVSTLKITMANTTSLLTFLYTLRINMTRHFAVGIFAVGHIAVGHFALRTLCRKNISPQDISPYDFFAVGHFTVFFAVRTFRRKYFFRIFGSFSHF